MSNRFLIVAFSYYENLIKLPAHNDCRFGSILFVTLKTKMALHSAMLAMPPLVKVLKLAGGVQASITTKMEKFVCRTFYLSSPTTDTKSANNLKHLVDYLICQARLL